MRVSVVVPTYKRGWALPYSLSSLVEQTIPADEVVVVLKPSKDGSEGIIDGFRDRLPIRLVIQKKGFVAEAMEMGIKNAYGDIILFIDDDAIAEKGWVAKYLTLFEKLNDAGGITGLIYQTSIKGGKQINNFNHTTYPQTKKVFSKLTGFYGRPLDLYRGYVNYISKSGFLICKCERKRKNREGIILDSVFVGANMGFRKEAIEDCPLVRFFKRSRKGYSYESFLAYWARRKGYNTYAVLEPLVAPIVRHISHTQRLTGLSSKNPFFDKFWFGYDVLMNYFRYRSLGADVSFLRYVVAALAFIRKDLPPRLAALSYTLLTLPRYLREICEQTDQM